MMYLDMINYGFITRKVDNIKTKKILFIKKSNVDAYNTSCHNV